MHQQTRIVSSFRWLIGPTPLWSQRKLMGKLQILSKGLYFFSLIWRDETDPIPRVHVSV